MPQPRIDMRVVRDGISVIRQWAPIEDVEPLQELADELDDRDDGADILVALRKEEADVILAGLRDIQREYEQGKLRMTVSRIAALDAAIEEINAAIRGVVVHGGTVKGVQA